MEGEERRGDDWGHTMGQYRGTEELSGVREDRQRSHKGSAI